MTDVNTRPYRQTKRAEKSARTRKRIVEAAIRLHETIGPALTNLSRVAAEAGVSRPTLYAHFPDDAALLQACTAHSLSSDPPPDPESWAGITPGRERVKAALEELYRHYERNESLTANVLRDMHLVPAMMELNAPMVMRAFQRMHQVLVEAFDDASETRRKRRGAAVAVAISFNTWQALIRQQELTHTEAVEIMTRFIEQV